MSRHVFAAGLRCSWQCLYGSLITSWNSNDVHAVSELRYVSCVASEPFNDLKPISLYNTAFWNSSSTVASACDPGRRASQMSLVPFSDVLGFMLVQPSVIFKSLIQFNNALHASEARFRLCLPWKWVLLRGIKALFVRGADWVQMWTTTGKQILTPLRKFKGLNIKVRAVPWEPLVGPCLE